MRIIVLCLLFSASIQAQSIGAKWGIFKPHPDLRGVSSPGHSVAILGTLNSPYALLPFEVGVNYWEAKNDVSLVEVYWGAGYRIFSLDEKLLTADLNFGAGLGQFVGVQRYLSSEKRMNVGAHVGFRLLHFGAVMDVRYRIGRLEGTYDFQVGGWEASFGYLLNLGH